MLRNVKFTDANLKHVRLTKADLEKTDFSNANLEGINLGEFPDIKSDQVFSLDLSQNDRVISLGCKGNIQFWNY